MGSASSEPRSASFVALQKRGLSNLFLGAYALAVSAGQFAVAALLSGAAQTVALVAVVLITIPAAWHEVRYQRGRGR